MSSNLKRKARDNNWQRQVNTKRARTSDIKEEDSCTKILSAVQQEFLGQLVVIQNENESPYVTLQNTIACVNIPLNVTRDATNPSDFVLKIDEEEYARGAFSTIQLARVSLAETTLEKLKHKCFFIEKKKKYVDITNQDLVSSSSKTKFEEAQSSIGNGSIAHKMMLKMGWSGKGLGIQEQGKVDTITVYENISRQGLGNKNIMKEITKVLDDFSKSTKLSILAFDSEFTKEERCLIHKTARKFNLKTKSEGQGTDRRVTVSRKLSRIDLVKELLKIGGENDSYKLHVPLDFAHLYKPELISTTNKPV